MSEVDWAVFISLASIGLSSGLAVGLTALGIRFACLKVKSILMQSVRIY